MRVGSRVIKQRATKVKPRPRALGNFSDFLLGRTRAAGYVPRRRIFRSPRGTRCAGEGHVSRDAPSATAPRPVGGDELGVWPQPWTTFASSVTLGRKGISRRPLSAASARRRG